MGDQTPSLDRQQTPLSTELSRQPPPPKAPTKSLSPARPSNQVAKASSKAAAFSPPTRAQALNGVWMNTAGLTCTVIDGQCVFDGRTTKYPVILSDGAITLNGWIVTAVSTDN